MALALKNVSEANTYFAHGKMKNEREEELPRLGEHIFKKLVTWLISSMMSGLFISVYIYMTRGCRIY